MPEDAFAALRPLVLAEVRRITQARSFSHAALLHQQLERYEEQAMPPALLLSPCACLLVAQRLGAETAVALPSAAALAFLGLMAEVFLELAAGDTGPATLARPWGMPRALNAGDAFFTLAQSAVLDQPNPARAVERQAAVRLLDGAARDLAEELTRRGDNGGGSLERRIVTAQRSLLPGALALAAVAAGAEARVTGLLQRFARQLSAPSSGAESAAWEDLSADVREALLGIAEFMEKAATK